MARPAAVRFHALFLRLLVSLIPILLLLACRGSSGRLISPPAVDLPYSDGVNSGRSAGSAPFLLLQRTARSRRFSAAEGCEQTYGFLPCTTTVVGNLFLVLAYGFLMFKAATFLSAGSELLLELLGPGIIGGLFLPILGAFPDALLILVSGLSGSKEEAQDQVLIGMGLLAGSTVFLLTLLWGSCVVVGKCDLSDNSVSVDSKDTRGCSLSGSGVSTDLQTSYAARIMIISIIPFVIVQLPKIFNFASAQRLIILISFIVSAGLVLSYCLYQIFQPWIQKRRLAYAKLKHVISGILKHAQMQALGRLVTSEGEPNKQVIKKLFHKIDLDENNLLSRSELRAFIIGIQFEEIDLDRDDAVDKVMDEFDTSGNASIEEEEFIHGISRWILEAKHSVADSGAYSKKFVHDFHRKTKEEHDMLIDKSDEVVEEIGNPTLVYAKAILFLLLGTIVAVAFADPLVDAVDNFSAATNIPSFFISFIAMPLATNSSEAVSALIFAARKKKRTSSLTFSEIYGGVTMNNTLCLAVFLALVYLRHLTWDFSSEVLVILLVCIVMGLFTSFRTTFPLWTCLVAYLLYPFSLALVYVLDFTFGWS
ncbi:hypothetical protein AXF42_Ash003005 [Apostasia shenzhenica]|uniref:EF-hand domain-containing protein n=1 Tax=Apostasia shenzhenica TaxID=1088818 RepID=A0A2I0A7W8_9ASPA|nr:hypothetical protein AXF42_Ash003005 [Apostasia shenzhenica]